MTGGRAVTTGGGKAGEILQVFARHVAERGYGGTNLSDVAAEVGISKGTIIHHFGTKERLLDVVIEAYLRRRLDETAMLMERLESPIDKLAGLIYLLMLYQVHDRDATVAFQREVPRLTGAEHRSDAAELLAQYLQMVRGLVDEGVATGQLRSIEKGLQINFVFGAAQWAWTWFEPGGKKTAVELGAELVELALGSWLVRRATLARLANPDGEVARVAQQTLSDAARARRLSEPLSVVRMRDPEGGT